jgi:hypothetical protein
MQSAHARSSHFTPRLRPSKQQWQRARHRNTRVVPILDELERVWVVHPPQPKHPVYPVVVGGYIRRVAECVEDLLLLELVERHDCRLHSWRELPLKNVSVGFCLSLRSQAARILEEGRQENEKSKAAEGLKRESAPPKAAQVPQALLAQLAEERHVCATRVGATLPAPSRKRQR